MYYMYNNIIIIIRYKIKKYKIIFLYFLTKKKLLRKGKTENNLFKIINFITITITTFFIILFFIFIT